MESTYDAKHISRGSHPSSQSRSWWQRTRLFFQEALRDNDEDFTTGPIGRALGLLAIPMMLEMAMESIFAVVDIAFVARLGTDAVAAVGITEALITVLYAMAIGLGMGVAGGWSLSRIMAGLLYEVTPNDPLTFLGVSSLLLCTGFVASWIPTVRGTRVDPMITMRGD